jgi:molybdenum cofactor synthesis domain-containing protein
MIAQEHRTVGDDRDAIAGAIRECAARSDAVIVTGGLGPTDDDLTREGLRDVVTPNEPLVQNVEAIESVTKWFRGRDRAMPEANLRQTMRACAARMKGVSFFSCPGRRAKCSACLGMKFCRICKPADRANEFSPRRCNSTVSANPMRPSCSAT